MTEQRKSLISRNTILAIGLAALAFTWPWEAQKAGTQEKGETSAPEQTLESVVEEESVSINWDEKGTLEAGVEVTGDEGAAVPVVRPVRIAKTVYTPVTPLPPRPVANAFTAPVTTYNTKKAVQPVQPPIDISIQNIQKQISDIIQLNETIKASQQAQVVEVQQILDQARIHKQILSDLTAGEEKQEVRPEDADILLTQEKVRLIGEQTEKNKRFIEEIEKALEAEKTAESKDQ